MNCKKSKRSTKKKLVDIHFTQRCIERIGYVPDTKTIIKQIQSGKLECIERQSNRITVWQWIDPVNGIVCRIPYDKERHQLITILFEKDKEYYTK